MMTSEDITRIKRGPADLEEIIKKQRARIEELERDKEILTKEIDRLSEYSQNLERLLRQ
jgi:prefoldin subunit 5